MSRQRCNEYWIQMAKHFAGGTVGEPVKQFTYGFLVGQAEKVSSGACQACMSAPLLQDCDWVREAISRVALTYGLLTYEFARGRRIEFWMLRTADVKDTLKQSINDNNIRARLCGIADKDIDLDYPLEAPVI